MSFSQAWLEFRMYFSRSINLLKLAVLAFLYLLIGLLAYSLISYLYFILPFDRNPWEFFLSQLLVVILMWGIYFGYIPTFFSGLFLYFVIIWFYDTRKISKIKAGFLGMAMGWFSITLIAFLSVLGLSRGFPPTFFIHYTFGSLIASLIGFFAGVNVYSEVYKQFQEGRIG